jgi:tetratricopeptide (TPR) repeat protein
MDRSEAKAISQSHREELALREYEWNEHRSETFAAEFVGTALILGVPEKAHDAMEWLSGNGLSSSSSQLADRALEKTQGGDASGFEAPPDFVTARGRISVLKRATARDVRNAIAWSELARWYTTLGFTRQAEHSIRIALRLAPNSRYILRSAACFFVGIGKSYIAHDLVKRSPSTRGDPWLLATELATANAAKKRPVFSKAARSILEHQSFSPLQLSELASELGTLELESGNDRRARRLFQQALVSPTENSLAQIEWASTRTSGLEISQASLDLPLADEARAIHAQEEGDWLDAFSSATLWLGDQSFSSSAAMAASFAASVGLSEWQQGLEAAILGLQAHPTDAGLLNNAAYPLIEMGRFREALLLLDRVQLQKAPLENRICIYATEGLLAFRTGAPEIGRRLYERAILSAHGKGDGEGPEAMATVMLAREELILNREHAVNLLQSATKIEERSHNAAVERWLKIVRGLLEVT